MRVLLHRELVVPERWTSPSPSTASLQPRVGDWRTGAASVLIVTAAVAAACGDATVTETDDGRPASITLSASSVELFRTETRALSATVRDAAGNTRAATVSWSSSDPSVVAIDANGMVTGVAPGTATIEARADGQIASAQVTVLELMGFVIPLVGSLNEDFFYVNYVDQQPGPALQDYQCGAKTYDGHRGTDLTLPSFARMDQGVSVVAAAPGTVSAVSDGAFDRNTQLGAGGFGNHVRITHRDGFESIYAHLARESITATVGQLVTAGTALGLVGSSGNSDMPHLHIEFRRSGQVVDPFSGPCGPAITHWSAPDSYEDAFILIGSGITDVTLTLDIVKTPPAPVDSFTTADSRVYMWVHLLNVRAGSVSRFEIYEPDGALFWSFDIDHDFYSMSWWWVWHEISGFMTQLGAWRIDYYHDGSLRAQRPFELVAGPVSSAPAITEARRGVGGGALERRGPGR